MVQTRDRCVISELKLPGEEANASKFANAKESFGINLPNY